LEKARNHTPAHPKIRAQLASAYALSGDISRAAAELAEARRLSRDDSFSSVARLLAVLEEGPSCIALDRSLQMTFGKEQERYSAAPRGLETSGSNNAPRFHVASLMVGKSSKGPALLVLPGASAFVPEGMTYQVDGWGNVVVDTSE